MASVESDVQVPRWRADLSCLAAGMRTWARWLLLPSLLMWPLWILTFGSVEIQMFLVVACAGPWMLAIALGALGIVMEFALGVPRRGPGRWRGRWLALVATSVWGFVLGLRLDARFFLWCNERELAHVVAQARTANAPM